MSENKTRDSKNKAKAGGESFDDLEDAFFASGDASGFWETADSSELDEESAEVPADEPSEEPAAPDSAADADLAQSEDVDDDPEDAIPAEPEAKLAEPEPQAPQSAPKSVRPSLLDDGGEFYNPSALHHAPDLIADDETEVWNEPEDGASLLDAATQILEADAPVDELELDGPSEEVPAVDAGEASTESYMPPANEEQGWRRAARSLSRAAGHADGKEKAMLMSESARILLSRAGDWDQAGVLFKAAIGAGLDPLSTPKGYADVIASQGDFKALRDLLVSRADSQEGPGAIEAYQDAAIVERSHLGNDSAAVGMLTKALAMRNDWFTLRLLRELHYKARDWAALVETLDNMAALSNGARRARCKVEQGRIRESEQGDLDGAKVAYRDALDADPSFLDGFLALARVAQATGDTAGLTDLYEREAKRTDGANSAFWYARAARASQAPEIPNERTVELYTQAMSSAADGSTSVHREAQAHFLAQGETGAFLAALSAEAATLDGAAKAGSLLELALVASQEPDTHAEAITGATDAVAADPSCGPAADLAVRLLLGADRPDDAMSLLRERSAQEEGQGRAETLFRMGEIAEHVLKDSAGAAALYAEAAATHRNHPFAALAAAGALYGAQQWEAAAKAYTALAETARDGDQVSRLWRMAADIHAQHLGDQDASIKAHKMAIEASALQPASIDALIQATTAGGQASEQADALLIGFQKLPNAQDRVYAGYRAARILSDLVGDPTAAQGVLNRCVELDPHCQPVVSLLRAVANQNNDWATVYDLRRIEANATDGDARVWHLLAAAYATMKIQGIDASAVALEILNLDASHPGALAVLERAALLQKEPSRLAGVYRRLRNGNDDPAKRTSIAVRLADLAQEAGDKQLAIRSITRVLEASVGPRPYGAMGRLAVSIENWALAEAALHADGDQKGLARLLETTSDDHKRVTATWRSISKADSDDSEAFAGLERALTRLGSREGLAETHGALARTETDPTLGNMHALLAGHLFENEDNLHDAIEHYKLAFDNAPFRGKAFDALIRIYGEQQNADAIETTFKAASVDDPIGLADALFDAGATVRAAKIYAKELSGGDSLAHLPLLVRHELALASSDDWPGVFETLGRRLGLTEDEQDQALLEAQRRWVLSERMADSDEAWDFYRKLHEDQPDDAEVLENLARIAGARGESKLAIQFLDGLSKIAATAEDAARYQRRVAEVHEAGNDSESARSAFLRALDHQPDDLDALGGLNRLARASKDWQALVGVLTRESLLRDGDARVNLAREIAEIWETKLEDVAVAMDAWRKVLELVPGDQTALSHLVDASRDRKEWATFIDDGQALVHYLEGEERTELLAQMGRVAIEHLQREDEAIRFLDQASLANPPSKQAAEDLERIHAGRGAWDQVVECTIRRASASEGDEAVTLLLRAAQTKKNQLRDRRGAAALYDRVLSLKADEPTALEFKGKHLFDTGDLEGAVAVFQAIEGLNIERDLEDFDVQMDQSLHYFNFGEALKRLGRTEDALTRYEQALALNRSHLPTLEAVGPLYANAQRWDDANQVFRQILQLTGGQGEPGRLARVYTCLGQVEHAQGNTQKAIRRFDKALEIQPNDINALNGYACVLYELKDWNNLLVTYNNIIHHAADREVFIHAYMMKGHVLDAHMTLADKAAQHYEKSLSFDASHPGALLRLAELALRKEDWDRAISYAGRALAVGDSADQKTTGLLNLVQAVGLLKTEKDDDAASAIDAAKQASIEAPATDADGIHDYVRGRLQAEP